MKDGKKREDQLRGFYMWENFGSLLKMGYIKLQYSEGSFHIGWGYHFTVKGPTIEEAMENFKKKLEKDGQETANKAKTLLLAAKELDTHNYSKSCSFNPSDPMSERD